MSSSPIHISPPVIAHRGASAFAPENTLAAFMKAKTLGFSWVEFDVMQAGSGELVVIHDETLERTTNGLGLVSETTYQEIKALDAGSWFSAAFADEKIPTLESVLALLQQHQLAANIEIKALDGHEAETAQKVLSLIQSYSMPVLISSFSHAILYEVRKQSATVPLGFLMHEWENNWRGVAQQLHCVAVNVNEEILSAERVSEIKASGFFLAAYTVNQLDRAKQLFAWGVDAVFSDCPQDMLVLVE